MPKLREPSISNETIARLDREAIDAVRAGDLSRFEELVERYKDRIVGLVGRQVGDAALAEDLAQDVFVRAFRGLKGFRNESKFSTWLFHIAVNVVNSYFVSRQHKYKQRSESLDPERHEKQQLSGADDAEEGRELKVALRAAVHELETPFREVAILCGLEGKSYEEASAMLNVPVGTIRSRLNRARIRLATALGKR